MSFEISPGERRFDDAIIRNRQVVIYLYIYANKMK